MKRSILTIVLFFGLLISLKSQPIEGDFRFGEISVEELKMPNYPKDSTASALVLSEFGKVWMGKNKGYEYRKFSYKHQKIKIFKKSGFDYGTFTVYLNKGKTVGDEINNIKATTYKLVGGKIIGIPFNLSELIRENQSDNLEKVKIVLPNIEEGSVLEVAYIVESPFIYYIYPWYFQSSIPKMNSEFWLQVREDYPIYISLKGYQELSKNESVTLKDCHYININDRLNCTLYKYVMTDIPAFNEEDYMTSKYNFLSALNFEYIGYYKYYRTNTKDSSAWKYNDAALKEHEYFGQKIKDSNYFFWKNRLDSLLIGETDTMIKAKKIYHFIQHIYTWNGRNTIYASPVRKIFNNKAGDSGDINLSLVSALNYAKISTSPVILSTRENGTPSVSYPDLSQFNYVIAHCKINGKSYFLDATEKHLNFGGLPVRCINGQGRIYDENFKSEWIEIPNQDKTKQVTFLNLKLDDEGNFKGNIANSYIGLRGFEKRKEITGYNTVEEYVQVLDENHDKLTVKNYNISNVHLLDTLLTETFDVEISKGDNLISDRFYLNPFLIDRQKENPFKSVQRLYPVDFGLPYEVQTIIHLEYPKEFEVVNVAENVALALPEKGGKFLFHVQKLGNKVTVNSVLSLDRAIYSSDEYFYLKELFGKVVQSQSVDLIFERKTP